MPHQDGITDPTTKDRLTYAKVRTFRFMGIRFHWLGRPVAANDLSARLDSSLSRDPVAGAGPPKSVPAAFFEIPLHSPIIQG